MLPTTRLLARFSAIELIGCVARSFHSTQGSGVSAIRLVCFVPVGADAGVDDQRYGQVGGAFHDLTDAFH